MRLRDGSGELTELADTGGVFHVQPRGVLRDGQNAAIAGALDAHEHDLFLGVDGKHLLAHGRHDGRAVVIQTCLVDVDILPAVIENRRVLCHVVLHRRLIELPEELIECLPGEFLLVFLRHCLGRKLSNLGIDWFHFRLYRLCGRRRLRFGAPGAFLVADGLCRLNTHLQDLVNDGLGQQIRRHPLVAHGGHGRLDVDRAPALDKAVLRVAQEEIEPFQTQNDRQPDGKHLQRLFLFLLLFLRLVLRLCLAAACHTGSRPGIAKQFHLRHKISPVWMFVSCGYCID